MIFIEASTFTKLIYKYLADDEYSELQNKLFKYPDFGKIIRGTGGVRKIRWAKKGRGKSGGIRVIYYWKKSNDEIWMLTVYGKSETSSIPSHVLRKIVEELKNE